VRKEDGVLVGSGKLLLVLATTDILSSRPVELMAIFYCLTTVEVVQLCRGALVRNSN
jgi:hypothetical protein